MSFPRYPKYKDSGVAWLGQVPGHWDLRRLGFYFSERREKVSDKDFPPLSVTKNGVVPQLETAAKSDDSDNRKKVCKGDFVINSRSDRKGSSGVSELDGSVSLICTVLRSQGHVNTGFVHHLLRSEPFQEEFYRNGKGIVADLWSTNYAEMRNIVLAMPPESEQSIVSGFLDREISKIDALVAEQRRLMELLKEKRQAVISLAVTKGLDRDVSTKHCGFDSLGDVPTHWTVAPLKRYCDVTDGAHISPETEGGIYPFISTKDVANGVIVFDDSLRTSPATFEYMVNAGCRPRAGDVLFSKDGTIGRTVVVKEDRDFVVASSLIILRPNRELLDSEFLNYLCQCHFVATQVEALVKGAGLPRLSIQNLRRVIGCFPPPIEQTAVAAFLNDITAKLNALTAEAERAIELLLERRTALVGAAVTGQFDVRQLVDKRPTTLFRDQIDVRNVQSEQTRT